MKIGMVMAMAKEAEPIVRGLVPEVDGGMNVYHAVLGGKDVVVCLPPVVGEIAAAMAAQLLICKYGVDVVVNLGVVGALVDSVASLDYVFVRDVVHYEMDVSAVDNVPVGMYEPLGLLALPTDSALLDKARAIYDFPLVRCASGNKFVADAQEKRQLATRFGADICEMEAAGVALACHLYHVPCLIVKRIADSLNDGAREYRHAAVAACKNFRDIAEQICAVL